MGSSKRDPKATCATLCRTLASQRTGIEEEAAGWLSENSDLTKRADKRFDRHPNPTARGSCRSGRRQIHATCRQLRNGFDILRQADSEIRSFGMKLFAPLGPSTNPVRLGDSAKRPIHFTRQDIQLPGPHHYLESVAAERKTMNSVSERERSYLGRAVWYLGFEQHCTSKAIQLSVIRLGNQDVGGEAVL